MGQMGPHAQGPVPRLRCRHAGSSNTSPGLGTVTEGQDTSFALAAPLEGEETPMSIGSSKQAAVQFPPLSHLSTRPAQESMTLTVHQTCTLEPAPLSLRPACKPLTSLQKAQTKRARGRGGGDVDGGIRCAGTTRSLREHGVSVCGRYHRGVLGLRASHAVARHGATSPIVA